MGLFYASGRLVYNFDFEYFISFPVPQCGLQDATLSPAIYGPRKLLTITAHKSCLQLRLTKVARNHGSSRHGIFIKIPSLAIGDNPLVEVSCHFLAHNLSQSRLVDISSILHPWLPTAGNEAMRPSQAQCVFFQQGIRIHRFPSHVSHPQPVSSTHRIFHSLYRSPITSHCIVHSSHRPHNYFFPSLRPSMYNKHSH